MNLNYLGALRRRELQNALAHSPFVLAQARVLEIGSGTGDQLIELRKHCAVATGVDLMDSNYAADRVTEIIDYDGHSLPFPEGAFDGVFSSNVMEHIPHFEEFQAELGRVVTPGGWAIHVVPTTTWRLWTTVVHWPAMGRLAGTMLSRRLAPADNEPPETRTAAPPGVRKSTFARASNALFPEAHGEFGNRFAEFVDFHPSRWRQRFERCNWTVVHAEPTGLFYTGYALAAQRLPWRARQMLSHVLGSACWTYYLRR